MRYIYNNKPVLQILNGDMPRFLRFKRHLAKGRSIKEAIDLSEKPLTRGVKTKYFYQNKPLTQLAKENNVRYETLLMAFHRGEADKFICEE